MPINLNTEVPQPAKDTIILQNKLYGKEIIEGIIESLLFSYGEPLPCDNVMELLSIDEIELLNVIEQMNIKYSKEDRGIKVRIMDKCVQLCSKPEYYEYIAKLMGPKSKITLSQAAYETLSIVAFNKQITRAGIEQIRGVNSDSSIAKLLEYNLISEAGRMDTPGRPIIYKITQEFLRSFGFSSFDDLSQYRNL